MLNFTITVKDQGVRNLGLRAAIAIQDASRKTAEEAGLMLSDAMKYYTPVSSGTLKAAIGKFEERWLNPGADKKLARANSLFKIVNRGNTWIAQVGTTLFYARWVNYGYTVEEDRVVYLRVGADYDFRIIRAGNRYPGNFMLEKGIDVARARLPRILGGNVRAGLTRAQQRWLKSPNYRPRGPGGRFIKIT